MVTLNVPSAVGPAADALEAVAALPSRAPTTAMTATTTTLRLPMTAAPCLGSLAWWIVA